jgi:thiosulfate dehydrogenase [quinone] large subunit
MAGGASVQTSSAAPLPQPSTETPGTGSPKGTTIGLASDVPLGGAREFTDPAQGIPAYVVRPSESSYVGFSAVCTHMGCTVGFFQPALQFRCPCHGSIFSAVTGEVLQGPAPAPLSSIPIEKSADGTLLADG